MGDEKNKIPVLPWMRSPVDISLIEECPLKILPCLDPRLEEALHNMGITSLFPVQVAVWQETIGPGTFERDLCINSPTGSGKTLAYALPIVQMLSKRAVKCLRALVVLPTRDLALQVKNVFAEIEIVAEAGPIIFPSIAYADLSDPLASLDFASKLKDRGVAVVRGVIPRHTAEQWKLATDSYLNQDPRARRLPTHDPHLYGVYWSPAQIKARAHPNVLFIQRFLMNLWHSSDPNALVSPNFSISYADRLRIRNPDDEACSLSVYVDGGSVERWELDGYGRGQPYQCIWDGEWENYDPWESSTRLKVTSDLYNGDGVCTVFRMFQGWVSLSNLPVGDGTLLLCPMLTMSMAYLLLRPFFTPVNASPDHLHFLAPENWILEQPPSSVIQGALPSYPQELNVALHPHLQLPRSMVHIPHLGPGDYLVWHPDAIYALDRLRRPELPETTIMYLPACPLTQTNALYLARQRKAFLLGHPSPDFGGVLGESARAGSTGVQEVGEAGGVDGLRAMGLLPWDEDEAQDEHELRVLEMANGILFPEKYDSDYF